MSRKSAYVAILRSHVDEQLAIARIVGLRLKRGLAQLELQQQGRRRDLERRVERLRSELRRRVDALRLRK
jgi:hypothetical protein